jgi:hypothetical protein
MTSILPLGEMVSRRTHQVQCRPRAFLTACWPRPGNHGETCTTPWIYTEIFHPIWFNSRMCDWTHESTWVFVMQLIGHAPLVTKARRCLQKKIVWPGHKSNMCHLIPIFDTTQHGGDRSIGRPTKWAFDVHLKEIPSRGLNRKKNCYPLPLYMHAGRYQILFCIIGRNRVNKYPSTTNYDAQSPTWGMVSQCTYHVQCGSLT